MHARKYFWAVSTSSEWGPQFPLMRSDDLVNWTQSGVVFPHRPLWARANFWAPEISEYKGKFYVYYVGRQNEGPLAVAVATADRPEGPYTDRGPLVSQPDGSIDPVTTTDEHGQRYLLWKEDGNSRHQPSIIWAQPLTDDGLRLVGEPKELFRNDVPWEGAVIEGPFVVKRGNWFYLFYAGSACCGEKCSYGVGVARAHALLGPWEKDPANPIVPGNADWRCPGHGSITADGKGRCWLLYHGYSAKSFVYTGREALLDEVLFGKDEWPTINAGKGPSVHAPSPYGKTQKTETSFEDSFNETELPQGWQWPQDREPVYHLKNGELQLNAFDDGATNLCSVVMARSTWTGDYTAQAELDTARLGDKSAAGLAVVGDVGNAVGISAMNGQAVIWRRAHDTQKIVASSPLPKTKSVSFKVRATAGHLFRFSFAADGKRWIEVGGEQPGDHLPPWDRGVRVGLTASGEANAAVCFKSFQLDAASM